MNLNQALMKNYPPLEISTETTYKRTIMRQIQMKYSLQMK